MVISSGVCAQETYNISCNPDETGCESKSLQEIAVGLEEQSDVHIDISIPQLQLTTNLTFAHLQSLTLVGYSNSTTITCIGSESGLLLVNITQLTARQLILTYCGARSRSTLNRLYTSGLTIDHGKYVTICDLTISKSRGLGLSILNQQGGGRVIVKSTIFKDNKLPEEYMNDTISSDQIRGGGGVYIGAIQQNDSSSAMSFEFDRCTFENNTAHTRYYNYLYTNNRGDIQQGYGRGGGAYMSFNNGLSNIRVVFSQCEFKDNMAFLGGGLSLKISGGRHNVTTRNITVEIVDSLFDHNGCIKSRRAAGFGGGAHLSFDAFNGSTTTDNNYVIRNVTFRKNCAQVGGAVCFFSSRQRISINMQPNTVMFDDCKFTKNKAHLGSAVNMMPDIFIRQTTGVATTPKFINCSFWENTVFVNQTWSQKYQRTAGIGTIYSSLYDIYFEGHNCFENNWGSAVYLVNGIVDFTKSSAYFINNTGLNGGAVALIGVSMIRVGENEYRFENNTALFKGGAIYVFMIDNNDLTTSRSCFIQNHNNSPSYGNWTSNFTFSGNVAKDNTFGHTIFTTTLNPCTVINIGAENQPEYKVLKNEEVFEVRGIQLDLKQVSTEGAYIDNEDVIRKIIPGEQYSHKVGVKDDLKHDVHVALRVMMSDTSTEIDLHPSSSPIIGEKIQLIGEPHTRTNVTLQTTSLQRAYIKMEVELLDCPPGFKLSEKYSCECNADAYVALFKCNRNLLHSHIIPGFWVGVVSDGKTPNKTELATTICPFCDYGNTDPDSTGIILPRTKTELTDRICGKTRTGTLCGSCRENFTVHFHSPRFLCKPVNTELCKIGWFFYLLSELVPVTVVFITVLVLNINFTSGALNGFILFSQVINTLDIHASQIITKNFPQTFQETISYPSQVYQIIYGFFNLDFFNSESLSFCLWNGASVMDMLAFKYVTILYTLLLIVVVISVISNCGGHCLGKCCRITTIKTSVTHGISTFLIMCYAQCIKVSLSLLISVDLNMVKGSQMKPGTRVWYDGSMMYFGREHLPYALPAIFCLVTVGLIPPVMLLMYPLLNKVLDILGFEDDSKIYTLFRKLPISNLKPLLDSFQGCFKDNLRFFAGLYFLYRWSTLLVYMSTTSYSAGYIGVGSIYIIMLSFHAISQPYVRRAHNIIDALLLTDLVLINSISFLNYYRTRLKEKSDSTVSPAILQLVLIYLPLVIMSIYMLFVLYKYLRKKGCKVLKSVAFVPKRAKRLRELVQSISVLDSDPEQDDDELPHRLQAGDIDYAYFEDSD